MPDALSKTVPIWCSVLNRLLFPNLLSTHELYTPPQVVSQSEHAQITALLPSFVTSLQALDLSIDSLKSRISKPLRPFWVTPDSPFVPINDVFADFHSVICCTVSRKVAGGEVSEGGYIQGAGDDTENWAHGLTAPLFWANHGTLLSTPESDLPDLIETLVRNFADAGPVGEQARWCVSPTSCLFIRPLGAVAESEDYAAASPAYTIALLPKATQESNWRTSATRLDIGLGPHKLGSRNLRAALPTIVDFVQKLQADSKTGNGLDDKHMVLACESGKDLSVGVALVLLCLFFDGDGAFLKDGTDRAKIDKAFIRRRLGWISMSMSDANPSRATLQSVNSFLMERR